MKSKTAPAQRGRPRAFDPDVALDRAMHVFWAKVMKALPSPISHRPCASIGQVFTLHSATRSSSSAKFSIDTWTGRSPILAKLWRHRRRGMWSKKYSSARPEWEMIRKFRQDASWSKARWPAEMLPFGRKHLPDGRRPKRYCVAAFNEQGAKEIFRKTLTHPIWPLT